MRIFIVLILVVTAVNVQCRPHNDGTDHTHSPVIAPDSESVIQIEGRNEAAVHHSDVDLGNFTRSGQTDLSHVAAAQPEVAAAETHHSDTYLTSSHTTLKPKKQVGMGHAPIIHVDNSGKHGDHTALEGKVGSVVSHGPMAKNVDNHEVKHNHEHEHGRHGHHDKHSTVHHAPMATEHHPKAGNAHHPQLSKTEPAVGHAPLAHPEQTHKIDRTDDSINEHSAVTSTVSHPPLATDHHPPKTLLAHHPSLSKSDPPIGHAPIAIPHGDEKPEETATRKKRSGPGGLSTHPKTPPRESIEEYQDSEESDYPSREEPAYTKAAKPKEGPIRNKRAKGSNQKSYARKTTTTTTTTTVATPTEEASSYATERASSEEHESEEEKSEGVREKRSKGSNQKTNVRRTTITTTTSTTTTPSPVPTSKEVFEASHRGSSEEQDSREQRNKKPEESEFREKRSKGSNRKPAAYTRTTTTTTGAPITKQSSESLSTGSSDDAESHEGDPEETQIREKRSKGSNQKSYVRKTTTTTTTTVAPTTQDSSNPTSVESSEEPESHDKPEETEIRSKRSKGSNHSFAKKPLTTHNYPTVASTISSDLITQDTTEAAATVSSDVSGNADGGVETDDIIIRAKRAKGSYQKTQPRKTTTTTTTAKPSTSTDTTLGVSESVSLESSDSSSSEGEEVTSEKTVREKRSKGSNQNSYAKKHPTTTTLAPKAPEPEVPASNVHHPSLSKTEPLNPAKPEEPIRMTKPEAGNPATVPEPINKHAQPPQIIPGSHPLAIPLPTNPPPS